MIMFVSITKVAASLKQKSIPSHLKRRWLSSGSPQKMQNGTCVDKVNPRVLKQYIENDAKFLNENIGKYDNPYQLVLKWSHMPEVDSALSSIRNIKPKVNCYGENHDRSYVCKLYLPSTNLPSISAYSGRKQNAIKIAYLKLAKNIEPEIQRILQSQQAHHAKLAACYLKYMRLAEQDLHFYQEVKDKYVGAKTKLFDQIKSKRLENSNDEGKITEEIKVHGPAHSCMHEARLSCDEPTFKESATGYARMKATAVKIAYIKLYTKMEERLSNVEEKDDVASFIPDFFKLRNRDRLDRRIPLKVNIDVKRSMTSLLREFRFDIQPIIDSMSPLQHEANGNINTSMMTNKPKDYEENVIKRHLELLHHYNKHPRIVDHNLYQYKDNLLKILNEHQVVLIQGETGCGKSTQIPQIIFDAYIEDGCGGDCNILVSQPRRITTIALAERVAKERNTRLGECVGYKIHLDNRFIKENGGIMFYTAGSLRECIHRSRDLEGINFVIIDEVHESTIDTHTVMASVKRLLKRRPDLKVILMSATLDVDGAARYFSVPPEACFHIPGRTFAVRELFLKDIERELEISVSPSYLPGADIQKNLNISSIVSVIEAIHKKKPPGAILVFVPGLKEIEDIIQRLKRKSFSEELELYEAHSKKNWGALQQVFDIPHEKRKVVVTTNICEQSITIPDISYVIDCGIEKNHGLLSSESFYVLKRELISKASAKQRAGRAGRTSDGEVYRLYSKETYDGMNEFSYPEIIRAPLENILLSLWDAREGVIEEYLQSLPVPPDPLSVDMAIKKLLALNLLHKTKNGGYEMTMLGRMCSKYGIDNHHAKAIVYSIILGCFPTMIKTVTVDYKAKSYFSKELSQTSLRGFKTIYGSTSDILTMSALIDTVANSNSVAMELCPEFISFSSNYSSALKSLTLNHIPSDIIQKFHVDQPEITDMMWRSCIASSTLEIAKSLMPDSDKSGCKYFLTDGTPLKLKNSSIFPSSQTSLKKSELFACRPYRLQDVPYGLCDDLTLISPYMATLFCGSKLEMENKVLHIKDMGLKFYVTSDCALLLINFRNTFEKCLNTILILSHSNMDDDVNKNKVIKYTQKLVLLIRKVLNREVEKSIRVRNKS